MRVVIAEDQALVREGIVRFFEDAGHDVVGSFGDATTTRTSSAVSSARPLRAPGSPH